MLKQSENILVTFDVDADTDEAILTVFRSVDGKLIEHKAFYNSNAQFIFEKLIKV